jgi:transcriptional regulator with XRE-family HTH domain
MPIGASQLSLIEAGKRQPSLRVVNALAQAVGVEWMRDLFLKRIAEADSKQRDRKVPKTAEDAGLSTSPANSSLPVERPSSTEVDLEL